MAIIPDSFQLLTQEQTDRRSAVSEFLLTTVGGVNNALYNRLNQIFRFKYLGALRPLNGGEDLTFTDIWPYELVGISGYVRLSGDTGTTSVDIHWINGAGDQGSILSAPLDITFNFANGGRFYKNLVDATEDLPSGVTIPNLTKTTFAAGDTLRLDVDSVANGVRDLGISLHYRARTL